MDVSDSPYVVGKLIRDKIKEMRVTNGYVIYQMVDEDGNTMSEPVFSNKIYGNRNKFTDEEVKKISKILKTDFTKPVI